MRKIFLCLALALCPFVVNASEPILIQEQGSFTAGGNTLKNGGEFIFSDLWNQSGQTAYGDNAFVRYQIPVNAKKFPLVFLHGGGQSMKTWETTPDGREGFANIFLRRGFSVYLVDQPRRGDAGFTLFRLGRWPDFYPDTQFPKDPESLENFYRQGTPNTGPLDFGVISDAMSAVLSKTGPAILVTHSQGGGAGWYTALKSENIRAIVAYEPGGSPRLFPEGEVPDAIPTSFGLIEGTAIPLEDFRKFTRFPIVIFYGYHIADSGTGGACTRQTYRQLRLGSMARRACYGSCFC